MITPEKLDDIERFNLLDPKIIAEIRKLHQICRRVVAADSYIEIDALSDLHAIANTIRSEVFGECPTITPRGRSSHVHYQQVDRE